MTEENVSQKYVLKNETKKLVLKGNKNKNDLMRKKRQKSFAYL